MATDIFVGSVAVGVVPDARGFNERLRADLVPAASRIGDEYGQSMSRSITNEMGKAGEKSAGAFDDTFKKRLKAALDALPKAKIDADSTEADRKVAELRRRMEALLGKEIGIDISSKEAIAELVKVDTGIEEVRRSARDIPLTFNTTEARAQLALLRRDANATGGGRGGILGKVGSAISGGGSRGGILGGIGNLISGGASAVPSLASGGANAASGAASGGGGIVSTVFSNPYSATAAVTAGIIAIPLIAQQAAGGIVAALGGALAGIGIAGAVMSGKLTKQWGDFTGSAKKDLISIGASFVPVISGILTLAKHVMTALTPVFKAAVAVIAGPFKLFSDTILKAFLQPAVKASIQAVAIAFGKILTAFTPDIPGIVKSFAESITAIANAVSKNPKAFANFVNFLFQIIIFGLRAIAVLTEIAVWVEAHWGTIGPVLAMPFKSAFEDIRDSMNSIVAITKIGLDLLHGHWRQAWADIKAYFIQVANDIKNRVMEMARMWELLVPRSLRHEIAVIFDGIRHDIAHIWDLIYSDSIGRIIRLTHDVEAEFNSMRHEIAVIYDGIRHDISSVWDSVWNNTIGRAIRGASDLMGVFTRLKNSIVGWFSSAGSWLVNAGRDIVTGLLNGIKSGAANIGGWIKGNVVDPIVNAVKHFFGIASPSTVMMPIGHNLVAGLIKGMLSGGKDLTHFIKNIFGGMPQALGSLVEKSLVDIAKLPAKALSAISNLGGKIGGFFAKLFGGHVSAGVSQWSGLVAKALGMLGLPLSLGGQVLHQMQTESGGNPNAINLTDVNAQHGDPSRGLLQTIGSTFAAYHVAGTSNNIYDPLANIAAAINYARSVYGPTLMRGGMGMGSGHGYDVGGWLPPGVTMAYNGTGQPERILSPIEHAALARGASGPTYVAHFDSLTGEAIESHVQTAFRAMSLTSGALSRIGRNS